MRTLAPDVHQLRGLPPNTINVYFVNGMLVDTGTPVARRRILRERESMRRLAALRPALVLFGHGPPLRDPDRLAHAAG